jgi:hypothetical protein
MEDRNTKVKKRKNNKGNNRGKWNLPYAWRQSGSWNVSSENK